MKAMTKQCHAAFIINSKMLKSQSQKSFSKGRIKRNVARILVFLLYLTLLWILTWARNSLAIFNYSFDAFERFDILNHQITVSFLKILLQIFNTLKHKLCSVNPCFGKIEMPSAFEMVRIKAEKRNDKIRISMSPQKGFVIMNSQIVSEQIDDCS